MVPLIFLEYELNEDLEKIFNRMKWAVEQETPNLFGKYNPDTSKHWLGEIDEKNLTFALEESGSYWKKHFNVVLKGHLELKPSKMLVKIKLGLANFTFLLILMIYVGTCLFAFDVLSQKQDSISLYSIIYVGIYPLFGTILIIRRMKSAERKLDFLFSL